MKTKRFIILGLKILALTIIMFILWSAVFGIIGRLFLPPQDLEEASVPIYLLLAVSFLNTIVLAYPVIRSRWSGLKLILVIFSLLFGIQAFMSQIETLYYNEALQLPPQFIWAILAGWAILAFFYSPLAVLILGKMKRGVAERQEAPRLVMQWREWVWKSALLAIIYVCLYFLFGYFVAWQNPELRQLYSGSTEILGFFAHLSNVLVNDPLSVPLQLFRALLWMALALPVIRMMKGRWWEEALTVGLLFAILMNSQLLLPNIYMPDSVRMSHLIETATENFIFGWLVVWLLNRHHSSLRELFQWSERTK